jgi:cell pole-organizing protein PopZ
MSQAGEPSVEEILASIKKVIARDNRAANEPERSAPGADVHDEDEVLDLGTVGDLMEEGDSDGDAPLITAPTADSIQDSLAALAMLAQPPAAPQIVRSGETSLEGLTRELLRPALAEWLDKNLPPMVERMVAAEIARIVAKKG